MKNRLLISTLLAAGTFAAAANAATYATFADPSVSSATPLFVLSGNTLSGGWAGSGLTLQTPGSAAPDYADCTFVMSPLVRIGPAPFSLFSGGNIQFFDNTNTMVFRIDFSTSYLAEPISFGATDFIGQNVVFSGPIVDSPTSAESFAFSFANQVLTNDGFTTTAAFTSSATPTPGAMALMGVAGLVGGRRRRA